MTISTSTKQLLDFIAKYESRGNYNMLWGNKITDCTSCTLNQVLDMQSKLKGPSTAIGRYQFIRPTLLELKTRLKLTGAELFNEELQDKLALALLERRGLRKFLAGKISSDAFILNLSKEWASLPKDSSGVSYYAGDGLNRAHAKHGDLVKVVKKLTT